MDRILACAGGYGAVLPEPRHRHDRYSQGPKGSLTIRSRPAVGMCTAPNTLAMMGAKIAPFLPWLAALLTSRELCPGSVDIPIDNTYYADR